MHHTVLQVQDLSIKLKIEGVIYSIIHGLSFELKKGKTLAIVGESGCGKTLSALAIMRLLPEPPMLAPKGKIFFKGRNLLTLPAEEMRHIRGRQIAMIFQDPKSALNPVFTIGVQLLEVVWTHLKLSEEAAKALVLKTLEDVHLPNPHEILEKYPHELSGGMLQRVMIAMSLLCSPDILIADEPTTALDVTTQSQILALLRELQEKKGMATLLITHDMGVVAQNADEVIVMYAGDQIEKGSVFDIFDHAAHPYTKALFASQPQNHKKKYLETITGFVPRATNLPKGCLFHPRCRQTMEKCKREGAPLFSLKEEGHFTKCWLYDQEKNPKK
jgi:oligopeptide/dipeptide ABC transporter ATP-binding protein